MQPQCSLMLCRQFLAYWLFSSEGVCGNTLPVSASKPEALACCRCTGCSLPQRISQATCWQWQHAYQRPPLVKYPISARAPAQVLSSRQPWAGQSAGAAANCQAELQDESWPPWNDGQVAKKLEPPFGLRICSAPYCTPWKLVCFCVFQAGCANNQKHRHVLWQL